jgi:hypothetical protein
MREIKLSDEINDAFKRNTQIMAGATKIIQAAQDESEKLWESLKKLNPLNNFDGASIKHDKKILILPFEGKGGLNGR